MKIFRGIFLSILSLALTSFCVYYYLIDIKDRAPLPKIHITDNVIIKSIIDTAIKIIDNPASPLVLVIGLIAILFYIFFSNYLHEFFSTLPLGSIRKYASPVRIKFGTVILCIVPSLIVGLYTAVHSFSSKYLPDRQAFCVKWLLPSAILLILIVFLILFINIILDGGIWGLIIRAPLLVIANFCFSIISGLFIMFSALAIAIVAFNALFLLAILVACLFAPNRTVIRRYYR